MSVCVCIEVGFSPLYFFFVFMIRLDRYFDIANRLLCTKHMELLFC